MNLKGYKFNTKEDFVYYIQHLIYGISKTMDIFEKHLNELETYIKDRDLAERPKRVISPDIHDRYNSMLGNSSNQLLNYFGDQAELGCSYQNYRKNIKKKSKELNLSYIEFTQEQEEELNNVTTSRNWSNHIPVSLIHSTKRKAFGEEIDVTKPISISVFEKYEGAWLIDLHLQEKNSLDAFKALFELLKKDYKELTGFPCLIQRNTYSLRPIEDLVIPEISFGIQSKKIKTVDDIKAYYEV
ncbi:hypothetical protein CHI12_16610 [Terribacillus saccharophilus]|uniref:Uncharacterized protein n=1 Tax=Terribacillus saccharophilus TaxID=361277 RepID=A0A268H935_9BACI|nr:hypothetical protein [Terribacillus saccharophilus]PAE06396.1 hypothetical protein CHI12_16610 [Terribacillus saccharophilus]